MKNKIDISLKGSGSLLNEVEEFILKKINNNTWKVNKQLPSEEKLMEFTGASKMTIRKAIDRLKEKEVLFAIRGSGVYVSPFYQFSKFKSLRKNIKATKVSYLPSTNEIPELLLNWVEGNNKIENKHVISFIKVYFAGDIPKAISLNWVNNYDNHYDSSKLKDGKMSLFEEKRFNRVINMHKMSKLTAFEQNVLGKENKFLPTTYSYYLDKERKIRIFRVAKILPEYFSSFEVLTRN